MIFLNFYKRETVIIMKNVMNYNKKLYHSNCNSLRHSSSNNKNPLTNNTVCSIRNNKSLYNNNFQKQQNRLTTSSKNKSASSQQTKTKKQSIVQWWLSEKEIPPRYTASWYLEMLLLCTVFGITGSTTMVVVRPVVSKLLGLDGTMKDGPWSYRICSLVIMTPIYATLLVCTGTLFGRHVYFRHFSVKMFSRFGIPPESIDKSFIERSKTFRKW